MTTLNPGDTYRFKIIDNISGALDYDTSLEWSARVLHVSYFDELGVEEHHDEYVYTGERVISVTVPDVST